MTFNDMTPDKITNLSPSEFIKNFSTILPGKITMKNESEHITETAVKTPKVPHEENNPVPVLSESKALSLRKVLVEIVSEETKEGGIIFNAAIELLKKYLA